MSITSSHTRLGKSRTNMGQRREIMDPASYEEGYRVASRAVVDASAEWWYNHIVGFLNDGLAKGIIEEYRKAMEEE